jgi:hypothetical protein
VQFDKLSIIVGFFIPFDAVPEVTIADGLTKSFGVEGFGPGFGYSAF